jgi:hypothetical protein
MAARSARRPPIAGSGGSENGRRNVGNDKAGLAFRGLPLARWRDRNTVARRSRIDRFPRIRRRLRREVDERAMRRDNRRFHETRRRSATNVPVFGKPFTNARSVRWAS